MSSGDNDPPKPADEPPEEQGVEPSRDDAAPPADEQPEMSAHAAEEAPAFEEEPPVEAAKLVEPEEPPLEETVIEEPVAQEPVIETYAGDAPDLTVDDRQQNEREAARFAPVDEPPPIDEGPLDQAPRSWSVDAPPPTRSFDDESMFGEPEIPMPGERDRRAPYADDARRSLDVDLGRIKRTKRFGFMGTIFAVLFIAFVLAPVTWVGVYRFIEAPTTMLMVTRAANGERIRHTPIPLERMSPNIVRAVIAAEDANFCTHHGFDVEAIQKAMARNADGGKQRGASTISQQTAKNLFLWESLCRQQPCVGAWIRKGLETYFTALVEFIWPKDRIMEAYLNAAEWGDGIFGIEAAAQARFGVSADRLTPYQAARLAAVLPSPNRYRVDNPGPYIRGQTATIVARSGSVRIQGGDACVLRR